MLFFSRKRGQAPVRIQDVAALVGPVEGARGERGPGARPRPRRVERAGAEHRHLALEHLVEAADRRPSCRPRPSSGCRSGRGRPRAGWRGCEWSRWRSATRAEGDRARRRRASGARPRSRRVDALAVGAPDARRGRPARACGRGPRSARRAGARAAQSASLTPRKPRPPPPRPRRRAAPAPPNSVSAEGQVAAQVAERDHRHAVADERVVGVVPLRPLGVHPDAGRRARSWRAWPAPATSSFSARFAATGRPSPSAEQLAVARPAARDAARSRSRCASASKSIVSCGSASSFCVGLDAGRARRRRLKIARSEQLRAARPGRARCAASSSFSR